MKKLLSILLLVSFYSMSASAYHKATCKVQTLDENKGLVWVTETANDPPSSTSYLPSHESSQENLTGYNAHTYTFYLYNQPKEGYYFKGWTKNADGSNIISNSNSQPYTGTVSVEKGAVKTKTETYYAVFEAAAVYNKYATVMAICVDNDGFIQKEEGASGYTPCGGYVNIGSEASNSTGQTKTIPEGYMYGNGVKAEWNYSYYYSTTDDYTFVGWYSEDDIATQLANNAGKLDLVNPSSTANPYTVYYESTTTVKDANTPHAKAMFAVFKQSLTYYHRSPSVYVSDREPAGGEVYVDNGTSGTINGVGDKWETKIEGTDILSGKANPISYTYYAKSSDDQLYKFAGWAVTQTGEPTRFDNPLEINVTLADEFADEDNPYAFQPLYAVFESFYYKAPPAMLSATSKGSGYVAVNLTGTAPAESDWAESVVAGETQQVAANDEKYSYSVHYFAKKKEGTNFLGWSTTEDGLNIIPNSVTEENGIYHYVPEPYVSTNKHRVAPHVATPLYAVFRSDIDIRQQDRMIVYIDDEGNGNINDAKILVEFQKANTLKATITGGNTNLFQLSNRSGSKTGNTITFDATQGLIELVVTYTGDLAEAVGKTVDVTFSANYGGTNVTRTTTITVEEAPIITFLPTDGKGSYTIKMTNGSGVNYAMETTTKENIKVAVTHESMSNIEMAITNHVTTDNYYFFGWQMIDGDVITYLSYDELCTYQFTKPVSVRAEFIPANRATYFIKNDQDNIRYHDLQKALDAAQNKYLTDGVAQVVVFNDKPQGTKVTEGILPKGAYTIHAGVTLLIPGDAKYTTKTKDEMLSGTGDSGDYSETSQTNPKAYIKWIVEDGTSIDVKGTLLVYSKLTSVQTYNARPFNYGHIELGENCSITLHDASALLAFGFITGSPTASITAKSGSLVKEAFQILGWRGGTATSSIILNKLNPFSTDYRVFPVGQYYVQNVEVPMTFEYGSSEVLNTGLNVLDFTPVEAPFIGESSGFFRMADGIKLKREYDPYQDKLIFTVIGTKPNAIAQLGNIVLPVPLSGMTIDVNSGDYVLPMPNNFDIRLESATVNVLYEMALLAGGILHVDKNSVLNVNNHVYVYDTQYNTVNGVGYHGTTNWQVMPVGARPGGMLYKRADANYIPTTLEDAKIVVDGVLNVNKGLYTTNNSSETVHCANITSNGGGKVVFASLGSSTKTYQIQQTGTDVSYVSIPVTTARLRNEKTTNGQYVVPNAAGKTYTYFDGEWKEGTPVATHTPPTIIDYIPKFNVSDITLSEYVGTSTPTSVGIIPNNNNVNWNNVTWTHLLLGDNADQFKLTGTLPNANVVFTPTSEGIKKATLLLTATYNRTVNSQTVKYTYTKMVSLTGNASYLAANTLAFADLNTVYKGQSGVAIFKAGGNNTQPITITANPASSVTINGTTAAATFIANTLGKVTLTATQSADLTNNIAATTLTKTIEVKDPVQWNWDILYLGERYDTPITMLDGSTGWTLTETTDTYNIIDFKGTAPNYTASVANLIAGEFDVTFTFTQDGQSRPFTSHVIVDPRHLRVDVNSDIVFRAVTLSANENVEYSDGQDGMVVFKSTSSEISQWKLGFFGVPDKIYFKPNGNNTWQIEESSNGTNWTTSFPWKYIDSNTDFELSLLPSTRYLRISYGAGNASPASLNGLYITELTDVKADVEKLYMPVQFDASRNVIPYTKEVVLTYANTSTMYVSTSNDDVFKVKESASAGEPTDVVIIPATFEQNPFGIKGIEVVSTATEEMEGYLEVYEGTTLKLQIPIQTYLFPQELPIKLATDKPDGGDRYYYVTTHTHNAEWDGRDGVRTITLNNAVSDAAPYLIFEFEGNPTYIGFNYSNTAKGTWELEQYIGDSWIVVPHTPANNVDVLDNGDVENNISGTFKRLVNATASKLRLIYQSEYAEKVNITDLVIVGDASAIADPARLELDYNVPENLIVSAINLPNLKVKSTNANFKVAYVKDDVASEFLEEHSLTSTHFDILNGSDMGTIPFQVIWSGTEAIEHGTLELTATVNGVEKLLATVELVGVKQGITDGDLGIYTGVAEGYTLAGKYKADGVTLTGKWQGDKRRPVNINAAFSPTGAALFDYVVVYGETTTADGSKTINQPNTLLGSNAKTPCYIYKKNGTTYQYVKTVENANSKEKAWHETSQDDADAVQIPTGQTSVSMYITGFCPYASTGYTKGDEGVWYFRANAGQSINVYLQDCYIYSRAKTHDGHSFVDRQDGNSFSGAYSCGSGAVLVFACNDKDNEATPMNVTICTLDSNLLKSNYGCFLQSAAGRAFQVSPAVQIRLIDDTYQETTTTHLNFTDEWPASNHVKTGAGKRTNGFLSLQKQHNNAPSIDMGAKHTVVNFNGGQVELQNAQIVSTNYISSMAICQRAGTFAGIFLAYGMGTDGVGGTVNFNDGTTTVLTMEVAANYRQYYLMDTDANGNELTTTSCLRTPANTFVKGGSHCMMRACTSPTSKGGAPKDKPGNDGKLLGLYKFPKNPEAGKKGGWTEGENGLVIPAAGNVPDNYSVKSVTPNTNGTVPADNATDKQKEDAKQDDFLNFWFDPDFEPSAKPEINVPITFWKTCMTQIAAQYGGHGGSVGGNTSVAMAGDVQNEEVVNLMYCKIDENILAEISKESYQAPVKNPAHVGEAYLPVHPSTVGEEIEHYITNEKPFQVEGKIYYITTATADVWRAFTAPFDVANIYIMETYPEKLLQDMEGDVVEGVTIGRSQILLEQAKHNADFAAFFAVTVALGQQKDFETIYREYIDWAKLQDKASGAWNGRGDYTLRGKSVLVPYNGSNWETADFYLNENVGVWEYTGEEGKEFKTKWEFANASDGKLMQKGMTYSMLLPFCTKCGEDIEDREFWDYWSGKFLIFESTDGPHIVDGTAAINEVVVADPTEFAPNSNDAKLTGNHTFNAVNTVETYIWNYVGNLKHSTFSYNKYGANVNPTESFLIANVPSRNGMPARGVTTSGQVIYDTNGDGTMTDVQRPGVSEGHSLFITSTATGINVAVAQSQQVRVMSATGAIIYSGMVQTAVDVLLPTTGVYVITGENEVHKILH